MMRANHRRRREIHWFPARERTAGQLLTLLRFRHGISGMVERLTRLLPVVLLGALLAPALRAATETPLKIQVHLTNQAHGELGWLIFAGPAGFPGNSRKALRHGFLPIPEGAAQMTIEADLPPGTYAVSVYEDLNDNHRLDHNFLGIPREPVGVSGNPRPRFGPPSFDQSSFRVEDRAESIVIRVIQGL